MTSNARNKRRARQRAQRDDVAYSTARRGTAAPEPAPGPKPAPLWLGPDVDLPERPGPERLPREDVERWCSDQVGASPEDLSSDLDALLDLTTEVEYPAVQEFEPDLDTIETHVVQRYESGTLALVGTAQARLSVEGVMRRTDADDAEEEGWVRITGDYDELKMSAFSGPTVTV